MYYKHAETSKTRNLFLINLVYTLLFKNLLNEVNSMAH